MFLSLCTVLREDDPQYTEDGCQPDGEVLRTLVQDSVLVVVRDALLRHQKTVAVSLLMRDIHQL